MRKFLSYLLVSSALILCFASLSFAQNPLVVGVGVSGNKQVASNFILSVVETKVGEPLDRELVQKDIDNIYGLGFFSLVDVSVSPQSGGIYVEYEVVENPTIKEIVFEGNTVYPSDELMELVFSKPGSVFNRVFFRHDLQRIKEKYEKDGYTLVRMEDVTFEDGVVKIKIVEPRVGDIIIQGNKKTKTFVIKRQILLKKGDLFNAVLVRHSLNKLNQLGFFEDVSLGFEPNEENPNMVNLVFTVTEQKTTKVGLSIGHGSSSGWTGGATLTESNYKGLGQQAEIGFETGDREQYWVSFTEPYMDQEYYSWKVGVYKRSWEDLEDYEDGDLQHYYDEDKKGFYFGIGKKFRSDEKLSWYALLDWHDVEIFNVRNPDETPGTMVDDEDRVGTNYSITGTLTYTDLVKFISYPDGAVYKLNVEQGYFEPDTGSEMEYTKYWIEARYYRPLKDFLSGIMDNLDIGSEDNPVIFASRLRYGSSSGQVPWAEQYFLGGSNDLRGYNDDEFEGDEMALLNAELRVPIKDAFSVVLFYDTGMASDNFSFSDMKDAYGIGVRVRTPLGNLRLDVAEGEYETTTHFGFGEMF
ncbi:POTRA domain-containing protein [Thermovirga sp.]|uniref:BamA/OMP85 family outer membrane protein n=1 Tax=Thermovirga sp. TaxID=2699834 RepID=UPI0025E020E1|nr:POTRA domain-containing protein [Thermovirga sp.]